MKQRLREFLIHHAAGGVALAYSGGTDSAVLLHALMLLQRENMTGQVVAYYMAGPLQPVTDSREAELTAQAEGVEFVILRTNTLHELPALRTNPPNRCYICKRHLFTMLARHARKRGLRCIMDGTNADDLLQYRPGLQALRELGIVSPLAETGIGKQGVRKLAGEWNLPCAQKPSSPCLATRFEYGVELTEANLRRAEAGEAALRRIFCGSPIRLRVHGNVARIELPREMLHRAVELAPDLCSALHPLGFSFISLDLEGLRSGSMDVALTSPQNSPSDS